VAADRTKVKLKAGELVGLQVQRISLVDRGAIRAPFKVQKREGSMIDVGKIFRRKADDGDAAPPAAPSVSALVVATKRADQAFLDAAKARGFSVEKRQDDSEAGTATFPQGKEVDLGKCQVVRLSPDVAALVIGFEGAVQKAAACFGASLGDQPYLPSLAMASDAFDAQVDASLQGEDSGPAIRSAVEAYAEYAAAVAALPKGLHGLDRDLADLAEPTEAAAAPSDPAPADPTPTPEPAAAAPSTPAEPTKAAAAPAEPTKDPAPADALAASVADLAKAVQGIGSRLDGIERGVQEARDAAATAKAVAEKADRTAAARLPATPGDAPRFNGKSTRAVKSAVPLIDTAFGSPEAASE
jgi:hypothetical protein